jgi:predicted amidohydrolase
MTAPLAERESSPADPRTAPGRDGTVIQVHLLQVAYGDEESVEARVARVADLVRAQRGADLVVLPELWAHGGFAASSWAQRAETLDGPTVRALSEAARDLGAVVHAGSIVERAPTGAVGRALGPDGRGLWNTSLLLSADGSVEATYRKVHRFGFGDGEPKILEAGEEIVTAPLLAHDGVEIARLGLATCYDLRFPELFRQLLDAGGDVFIVPAAWPAARIAHWQLLGRARALENQSFLIQCNTAGTHSGTAMGGRSQVVSPEGVVLAEAGADEEVLSVRLDLRDIQVYRRSFPVLSDRRLATGGSDVGVRPPRPREGGGGTPRGPGLRGDLR